MNKGCLIAIAAAALLIVTGIVTIRILAAAYDKRPKAPGEVEVVAAEKFIQSYDIAEASGNSPAAIALAADFAREMRVSRQMLFTPGKAGAASLSKGRFLTYCSLGDDSLAILVHVPELRRFTEDAKLTMEEYAWTVATGLAAAKHPKVTRLAMGMKGALNYYSIVTGSVNLETPLKGIEKHHPITSTKPLWPFFETTAAAPAAENPVTTTSPEKPATAPVPEEPSAAAAPAVEIQSPKVPD